MTVKLRPENLLDFLVWCNRKHKEEKLTLYELQVIGGRAIDYIAEVDEE